MACCKPCCGCADCTEGGQGKCCCGGSEGTCCQEGEYCCDGVCQSTPCDEVPGCTNPYSPNYNPDATCDDGSCETCCNQGLCVIDDPDCSGNCNSLTQAEGCNDDPESNVCLDCCDSFCQDGCVDPFQAAPEDCSPTFATSFVVTAENDCDGVGFTYYNCEDCDYAPPP